MHRCLLLLILVATVAAESIPDAEAALEAIPGRDRVAERAAALEALVGDASALRRGLALLVRAHDRVQRQEPEALAEARQAAEILTAAGHALAAAEAEVLAADLVGSVDNRDEVTARAALDRAAGLLRVSAEGDLRLDLRPRVLAALAQAKDSTAVHAVMTGAAYARLREVLPWPEPCSLAADQEPPLVSTPVGAYLLARSQGQEAEAPAEPPGLAEDADRLPPVALHDLVAWLRRDQRPALADRLAVVSLTGKAIDLPKDRVGTITVENLRLDSAEALWRAAFLGRMPASEGTCLTRGPQDKEGLRFTAPGLYRLSIQDDRLRQRLVLSTDCQIQVASDAATVVLHAVDGAGRPLAEARIVGEIGLDREKIDEWSSWSRWGRHEASYCETFDPRGTWARDPASAPLLPPTRLRRAFAGTTDAEGVFRLDCDWPEGDRSGVVRAAVFLDPARCALARVDLRHEPGRVLLQSDLINDRPIYRPGDTVQMRLITRRWRQGRALDARGLRLQTSLLDPDGRKTALAGRCCDETGGVNLDTVLPLGAKPGLWRLEVKVDDLTDEIAAFRVEEYRLPPVFIDTRRSAEAFELRATRPSGQPAGDLSLRLKVGGVPLHLRTDAEGRARIAVADGVAVECEVQDHDGWSTRWRDERTVSTCQVEIIPQRPFLLCGESLRLVLKVSGLLPGDTPVPARLTLSDDHGQLLARDLDLRRDRVIDLPMERSGVWVCDLIGPDIIAYRQGITVFDRVASTQAVQVHAESGRLAPGAPVRVWILAPPGRPVWLAQDGDGLMSHQRLDPGEGIVGTWVHAPSTPATAVRLVAYSLSGVAVSQQSLVLPIDDGLKDLRLEAAFAQAEFRPGDEISGLVTLTDAEGAPLVGRVALAVVDEALFRVEGARPSSFAGFTPPPPEVRFDLALGWTVEDGETLFANMLNAGRVIGYGSVSYGRFGCRSGGGSKRAIGRCGGGGEQPMRPRRDFPAVAYWCGDAATDVEGRVRFQCRLGEQTSTWRLTASAVTGDRRGATTIARCSTALPVQARLALPRVVRSGDAVDLGALALPAAGVARTVDLRLSITGVQRTPLDVQGRPEAAPGREGAVVQRVAIKAPAGSTLELTARVQDGDQADAMTMSLPVRSPLAERHHGAAGQVPAQGLTLDLPVLGEQALSRGTVVLAADPRAVAAGAALRLMQFPWWCSEQTASRLVPAIAGRRAGWKAGEFQFAVGDQRLAEMLSRLDAMSDQGRWGWWGGWRAELWLTAWIRLLGNEIEAGGGSIPWQEAARRSDDALFAALARNPEAISRLFGPAPTVAAEIDSAANAWAEAEAASGFTTLDDGTSLLLLVAEACRTRRPECLDVLLAAAGTMDDTCRALLALACRRLGDAATAASLLAPAPAPLARTARGRLDDAVVRSALRLWLAAQLGRQDLDGAVAELLDQRRGDDWGTTFRTAWAILALSVALPGEAATSAQAELRLDGRPLGRLEAIGGVPARLDLPALAPGRHALTLVGSGWFGLSLDHHSAAPAVADPRLTLRREVVILTRDDLGVEIRTPWRSGQSVPGGTRLEVALVLDATEAVEHLCIEDPRAAGLEPVERVSGNDVRGVERVWRADRAAFFLGRIERGRTEIRYQAVAETPGDAVWPPARAWAMYDPGLEAESPAARVAVSARPALPSQATAQVDAEALRAHMRRVVERIRQPGDHQDAASLRLLLDEDVTDQTTAWLREGVPGLDGPLDASLALHLGQRWEATDPARMCQILKGDALRLALTRIAADPVALRQAVAIPGLDRRILAQAAGDAVHAARLQGRLHPEQCLTRILDLLEAVDAEAPALLEALNQPWNGAQRRGVAWVVCHLLLYGKNLPGSRWADDPGGMLHLGLVGDLAQREQALGEAALRTAIADLHQALDRLIARVRTDRPGEGRLLARLVEAFACDLIRELTRKRTGVRPAWEERLLVLWPRLNALAVERCAVAAPAEAAAWWLALLRLDGEVGETWERDPSRLAEVRSAYGSGDRGDRLAAARRLPTPALRCAALRDGLGNPKDSHWFARVWFSEEASAPVRRLLAGLMTAQDANGALDGETDHEVRVALVRALDSADAVILTRLRGLLTDADPALVTAAAEALDRLVSRGGRDREQTWKQLRQDVITALPRLEGQLLSRLVGRVRDDLDAATWTKILARANDLNETNMLASALAKAWADRDPQELDDLFVQRSEASVRAVLLRVLLAKATLALKDRWRTRAAGTTPAALLAQVLLGGDGAAVSPAVLDLIIGTDGGFEWRNAILERLAQGGGIDLALAALRRRDHGVVASILGPICSRLDEADRLRLLDEPGIGPHLAALLAGRPGLEAVTAVLRRLRPQDADQTLAWAVGSAIQGLEDPDPALRELPADGILLARILSVFSAEIGRRTTLRPASPWSPHRRAVWEREDDARHAAEAEVRRRGPAWLRPDLASPDPLRRLSVAQALWASAGERSWYADAQGRWRLFTPWDER